MIRKAKEAGILVRLRASRSVAMVNLQYVDDTLLFGNSDIKQATGLKWILCCFETWLGLRINLNKSSIINLGNANFTFHIIQKIYGCKQGQFLVKYLGTPLKLGRPAREDWREILDKLERRHDGCQNKYLSIGGRVVLLNAALTSTPMYLMSYRLLKWDKERVDRIS